MKKIFLFSILILIFFYTKGQLNPVKNIIYQQTYNYGNYNCPSFNCFNLSWTEPDSSATDTLIGYNIYHNDILYIFVTATSYGCTPYGPCSFTSPSWYNIIPSFWIKVKAVYNKDSATSIAADSALMQGVAIGINENSEDKYFRISLNPFSTLTVLQTDNFFNNATLKVYNSFGQIVKQIKNISGQTVTLYRDNLPSGLYFIRLTQDNNVISTDKLVIID